MMGRLGIVFLIATIISVIFLGPAGWAIGVAGVLLVIFSPFLGAAQDSVYECKSCSFQWSFRDIEPLMQIAKQNH
ncbi:MAG TPA: hypothetical protein VFO86_05585 [Terriglobia bacterium]|nr:hypothetical protein [Terriglobia bacterium]